MLPVVVQVPVAGFPAGDEHLAALKQRCRVGGPTAGHATGGRPGAGGRSIELRAGEGDAGVEIGIPAGDQHLAALKQGSCVASTDAMHAARQLPGARWRRGAWSDRGTWSVSGARRWGGRRFVSQNGGVTAACGEREQSHSQQQNSEPGGEQPRNYSC